MATYYLQMTDPAQRPVEGFESEESSNPSRNKNAEEGA